MVSSYQDEGVVVATFEDATGSHVQQVPFTLRFKRPNFFRFERISYALSKSGAINVVWCNGKESFTYLERAGYEPSKDLASAIASATGVSIGSIYTIPRLLLPDVVSGFQLQDLLGLSLAGEEDFEGVACYRLKGKNERGVTHDLWIAKKDLVIRKVRTEKKYEDYVAIKEEIHRNIRVDELIAKGVFDFMPPHTAKPKPRTRTF